MNKPIDYKWFDCTAGFICPNCKGDQLLQADVQDGNEWRECPECGLKYRLVARLEFQKEGDA